MRWVKLTLPPVVRPSWLLMTVRLTSRSFAGTARTLVAVGNASEASMLAAIRPAAPRRGVTFSAGSSGTPGSVAPWGSVGFGGAAAVPAVPLGAVGAATGGEGEAGVALGSASGTATAEETATGPEPSTR